MMKRTTAGLTALLLSTSALQSATLLPNGQQQFVDGNGQPYASGTVTFYSNFPTCSVLTNTWSDSGQTVLNTNPVVLDSAGRATIFGSGTYCQVLQDSSGNTIWQKETGDASSTSTLGWGGTSGGTANAQTVSVSSFAYQNGQTFYFSAGFTNTGGLTLSVNGGAITSVVRDTPTGTVLLTGGEVVAGNIIGVTYDQPTGRFHLVTNNVRQFGLPTSIPASSSMDLNSSSTHVVTVTGSGSSITTFGAGGASASANTIFYLTFTGNNTIVAGANITTPSGGNITVSNGASLTVLYTGSGTWQILQTTTGSGNAGQVFAFAGSACPAGSLAADGSSVSATTYAGLYSVLGTTWGTSAGNVVLPDFRGMFARGATNFGTTAGTRTTDPLGGALTAQALGAFVDDQFESHTHTTTIVTGTGGGFGAVGTAYSSGATSTGATGGTETNPKNYGVLYCVNY